MVWQAGERVELSCELSCAKAEVCWFRDGLEVDEADGLVLEVDGAHRRLVIPCSCPEDTGEYLCESADDSVTFLLTVEGTAALGHWTLVWTSSATWLIAKKIHKTHHLMNIINIICYSSNTPPSPYCDELAVKSHDLLFFLFFFFSYISHRKML